MSWFECKLTYDKEVNHEGKIKKTTESYLVDAESFTEAEARMTEYVESRGTFVMDNIRKVRIAEVFLDEQGDRFYKAKVGFITLDEKSGTEKKKYALMIVQATDLDSAIERFRKGMSGTLSDYELAAISETTLMDVLPYVIRT